jgi:hypothetical protein
VVDLSRDYASLTAPQTPADGGAQARANIAAASTTDVQQAKARAVAMSIVFRGR